MIVDRQRELDIAKNAVKAAEVKLSELSTNAQNLDRRIGREWKIEADAQLESVIISHLQDNSDYPIFSEESGNHKGIGDSCWIVDPLDGSFNFLRGLPMYCISVGLWKENQPVLGVILDIHNNQLFTGVVGDVAKCNGNSIHVNKELNLDPFSAVLCTGFPTGLDHTDGNLGEMVSLFGQFGKVRMLGSAALMLCYVASGRCDSYWERRIGLWDVAAGVAIVVAAGGEIKLREFTDDFRVDVEAACASSLLISRVDDD